MLERRRIFPLCSTMAEPTLRPYPTKVLLAWAEAISGNEEFRDWLMGSEYPELGVFCHALHNEPTSLAWMRHAGHHVLIALLEGTEGNEQAVAWLREHGHDVIADMALAADNDDEATVRLMAPAARGEGDGLWAQIAVRIREVKNEIEAMNNDVHRIDPN